MAKDRHRKSRRTNRTGPNPRAARTQGAAKPAAKQPPARKK